MVHIIIYVFLDSIACLACPVRMPQELWKILKILVIN